MCCDGRMGEEQEPAVQSLLILCLVLSPAPYGIRCGAC